MVCTFMEVCGRFLYFSPESHRRTKIYLDQMMRKKIAISMDSRCVLIFNEIE
jgi:regulator of nonsense transcripts 2